MNTKLRKTYNLVIKVFIVVMTFTFLYNQIFQSKKLQSIIDFFPEILNAKGFALSITVIVLLLFVNYLLESIKWQFFIGKLERVSLINALKAVLTGVSISMFMPNRVGDYMGRVFILKTANRIKAILATILATMSQLITTILFGSIATLISFPKYMDMNVQMNVWIYTGLWVVVILGDFTIVFFYLNFGAFTAVIKRISGKGYKKIKKYADVFSLYRSADMLYVLLIAILRYLVFSFQFYLLLHIFKIEIDYFDAMVMISLVYLAMAIIPTIALTEIGVRGSVSIFIFSYYFNSIANIEINQDLGVASASTALWLINLVIPAIAGAIFVFSLKFFRKTPINGKLD